eukprot:NODE_1040_length_2493_cov_0.830827.p1 type:complete len:318 gc:universal NODE_1040_length_2493_cov_0.830827:2143-1190(-)
MLIYYSYSLKLVLSCLTLSFQLYSIIIFLKEHKKNKSNKKRVLFSILNIYGFVLTCLLIGSDILQIYVQNEWIHTLSSLMTLIAYFIIGLDFLLTLLYTKNIVYVDKLVKIFLLFQLIIVVFISGLVEILKLTSYSFGDVDIWLYCYYAALLFLSWIIDVRFINHMAIKKQGHTYIMANLSTIVLKLIIILLILAQLLLFYFGSELEYVASIIQYTILCLFSYYLIVKYKAYNCLQEMSGLYKVHASKAVVDNKPMVVAAPVPAITPPAVSGTIVSSEMKSMEGIKAPLVAKSVTFEPVEHAVKSESDKKTRRLTNG